MKSFLLSAFAFLAICTNSYAQDYGFKKGSKFVEGGLSYNITKENGENSRLFKLSTNLGYFLSEKFAVGPKVTVIDYKNIIEENPDVKIFTAGAFGRYYFLNLGNRFKTYSQVGTSYIKSRISFVENDMSIKRMIDHGVIVSGDLGANYFITPNLSISILLGSIFYMESSKEKRTQSTYEFIGAEVNGVYNSLNDTQFGLTYSF